MLIDTAFFRDFNSVDDNVDSTDIDKKIFKAQRKLSFLLGPAFYAQIVAQFDAATDLSGLSADNLALYDPYIKDFLAQEAYIELLAKGQVTITRSGPVVLGSENNTPAADKLVGELIKSEKQSAETYKNGMISFIEGEQKRDSTKYPLYSCGNKKLGTMFQITSVQKIDTTHCDINNQVIYGD